MSLPAAGSILAAALAAQPLHAQGPAYPAGAVVQPLAGQEEGAELRRHLTALAENPRSLSALIGAGRAALASGDAEAALSFFARADEVSPSDARAKAGMASALVHLERPEPALAYFAESVSLGAPEVEIAGDRGLAFDLLGDPRRAQQDYLVVLRRGDDPEVRRRLALSLAISGHRDAALQLLAAQLQRQDRAGWRAQAFVMALTGDSAAANDTARRFMSPNAAQAMAPFFARLPSLSPSQKALAVHFGHFPADGRASAGARGIDTSAWPAALAFAGGAPEPAGQQPTRTRTAASSTASRAPRRRPGRTAQPQEERVGPGSRPPLRSSGSRQAAAEPRRREPARQPPVSSAPVRLADAAPQQREEPAQRPIETFSLPPSRDSGRQPPAAGLAIASAEPARQEAAPEPDSDLDDIAAVVASLPAEQERSAPPRERPPARAAASEPRAQPQRSARAARPAHPSRHWVQIAGGADRTALPRELARLRGLAPGELNGRAAWTVPSGATNRLLVGPFASAREAQEFVNRLAARDLAAFPWTSAAGQEIHRLPGR